MSISRSETDGEIPPLISGALSNGTEGFDSLDDSDHPDEPLTVGLHEHPNGLTLQSGHHIQAALTQETYAPWIADGTSPGMPTRATILILFPVVSSMELFYLIIFMMILAIGGGISAGSSMNPYTRWTVLRHSWSCGLQSRYIIVPLFCFSRSRRC